MRTLFSEPMTEVPCPMCHTMYKAGGIRRETVLPLPRFAAMGRQDNQPCCRDCQAADTLVRLQGISFHMARIAIGNDRQEQLRLPGVKMGLVQLGITVPNAPGDLEKHHDWLAIHVPEVLEDQEVYGP